MDMILRSRSRAKKAKTTSSMIFWGRLSGCSKDMLKVRSGLLEDGGEARVANEQ